MRIGVFSLIVLSATILTLPKANAATSVTYSNVSGLNYDFINIKETSSLETFLGAPRPAPNPAIDTLVISGGTLQVITQSGGSPASTNAILQHAATAYSFDVVSKSPSTSIDKLKISLSGQYALNTVNLGNTNNYASVSVQIPMTIQLLSASGIPIEGAPQKGTGEGAENLANFTFNPDFPQYSLAINGFGNVDFNNSSWNAKWENVGQDLNQIFNLPSLKITQLSLSITPDLAAFRSISDLNSASVTLTNASFQVVPEPSSGALFVAGCSLFLLRRRSKKT